jgi:hypothetical protein
MVDVGVDLKSGRRCDLFAEGRRRDGRRQLYILEQTSGQG